LISVAYSLIITGDTLTLDYQANQSGTANITIRGTSNGQTIDDLFLVIVTADDDPPTVINPIADVNTTEDAADTTIDLSNVFTDIDNDDASITKTVQGNSNPTLVSASITDNTLTLDYQANQNGATNITIRGTSNGQTVDDEFTITVNSINDAPEFIFSPDSISFNEDDSLVYILSDLYGWVDDPDSPDDSLIFVAEGGDFLSVTVDSPRVVIKADADWYGIDSVSIIVSDGEFLDTARVIVNVTPLNDRPIFIAIPDSVEFMNTGELVIELDKWVEDKDLPDDSLRWEFSVSDESLKFQFNAESAELTLTASDFLGTVRLRFTVTDDSAASSTDSVLVNVTADPTAIDELTSLIPKTYSLSQNYPNPFNPLTHIKFGMPKAGDVVVEIYNILGQRVKTLWTGFKPAGYHIIDFNAAGLSTGIYFYRMQAVDYTKIKKMILMK
jgi:hypothetical protein